MVQSTAKDMPRTVREVRSCQVIIESKYVPAMGRPDAQVPAWPALKALPQRYGPQLYALSPL